MKTIVLKSFGSSENLEIVDIAIPVADENEVIVKVQAISINPVDIKTRAGKGMAGRLKEHQPLILGWDISGVVSQVGSKVTALKIGDEVFGMVNFPGHGKAYAEYVAAPASHLAKKPANISFEEAAASTLAALTAWQALVHTAKIKKEDKVLIHGASGGVGHYAVQIAKYIGAHVIGTSSLKNKNFVLSLGANEHIDYKTTSFEKAVSNLDIVLDTVGGENNVRSVEILRHGGTLVSILGLNEEAAQKAKEKGANAQAILVQSSGVDMQSIANLLEQGIIKSHVSKTFSFDRMKEAHDQMESGSTVGKIVVTV